MVNKITLSYVGSQPSISSDPSVVSHSSALILPGVGSFKSGMDHLEIWIGKNIMHVQK